MKISTNWIKDYVKIDENLKLLADKITKCGINVESVETNYIANLKIGLVKEVVKHPDSDHLHICQVDVGESVKQIVCGASNVKPDLKVIVALEGAILPGDFIIKKTVIRGVESHGMICALYELGLEDKEANYDKGIYEVNDDVKIGTDAMEYLNCSDTIYTLDLNPNRNDCLSHLGFAYEVAAVTNKKVVLPDISINCLDESIKDHFTLNVDTDNCYLYMAKMVRDVVIKDSPQFIQDRLKAAGMRSINNVVDISNYIMLEYGQPLHFFDQDKLGNHITVRMASNEEMVTLDGKTRSLNNNDIIIADNYNPVCIAGVMGGLNTEVDHNTKNLLIEAAIFNPYNIRYTSLNLNLRSEASLRYEKKLNADYTKLALLRACHLLEKYASGKVLKDELVVNKIVNIDKKVFFTLKHVNDTLGVKLTVDDVINSLNKLDFEYQFKDDLFEVIIPNRRMDIDSNKADLIEEIGRLYGFDKIEPVLPVSSLKRGEYLGNTKLKKDITRRLRSLGLNEVRTYTLISEEEDKLFNYYHQYPIKLLKPLSNDKTIIRQTLIPALINVCNYNKAHGVKDVLIYEIANTYFNEEEEDTKVSALLKGDYLSNSWNNTKVKVDFYLLKGILEDLLNYLGYKNRYSFIAKEINDLHPGISAVVILDNEEIGFIGKVSPNIIKDDLFVFELSMNKLNKQVKEIKHKEISKYPNIVKDVSFIINDDITSDDIVNVIRKSGGKLLTDIKVFDVYDDKTKSIAYSLTFNDSTKTLTDNEVNEIFNKIISNVTDKLNCQLKSI